MIAKSSGNLSPEFRRTTVWQHAGRLLRGLRERRGFSVQELARRAGLSPEMVAAYEAGRERYPGFEACWRLSTALGVDLVAFLEQAQQQAGVSLLADVARAQAQPAAPAAQSPAATDEKDDLSSYVAQLQGRE